MSKSQRPNEFDSFDIINLNYDNDCHDIQAESNNV